MIHTIQYSRWKILTLLTVALFGWGCGKKGSEGGEKELRNVILTEARPLAGNSSTTYSGIVEEGSNVNAAFMADGKIGKINVKEGDRVSKGQLLAVLDDADYRIGVSQLEAQFNQMTREKERMDAMYERHNIAPNDYEKFTTGYEQLKLQLDMAHRKLGYTRLYAPASGYVAAKYMSEGELVGAGTPVFNIVDDSRLMATVDLPVNVYLEKDRILSAEGKVPGIEGEIKLKPVSFTPDVDNNMLYHLKLDIPAAVTRELTPGMNITVTLLTSEGADAGMLVPSRAIFSDNGKTYVWVYEATDSTIHKKPVVVEGKPEGRMSTVSGLDGADRIVETGVRQLYEGEKVNVLNKKNIGI